MQPAAADISESSDVIMPKPDVTGHVRWKAKMQYAGAFPVARKPKSLLCSCHVLTGETQTHSKVIVQYEKHKVTADTIAQEPQTIELSCMFVSSNMSTGGRWFTHNSPPIIFSVCSESRAAAYYEYTLLDFSPEQIGQRWQTVFINWERDTLWLCNDLSATWAKDLFGKNEQLKENLKNLSVGENLWKAINPMGDGTATSPTGLKTKATDVVGKLRVLKGVEFHS